MMTTAHKQDLTDTLEEAQEHLHEAIRLLEFYVRETNDLQAEAYMVDHLKIFAGRDHGFLSDDLNIDDLIEQLDENEADDEPDDDMNEQPETSYPKRKTTKTGCTLYLLENNNGPILNAFGEPIYVTIPED